MELWLSAIGEYGFPIVVTFYLLYRIEKKLDQLNHSVLQLQKILPFLYSKANNDGQVMYPPTHSYDADYSKVKLASENEMLL
ncbi:hypothetical protein CR203_06880 [Salipaludibacillus neizhouensis]|uniref:YvrJ family protein n=1 Tax=Salipaludibacillus neizhouensis TaxID=885475 RepID=A0A3A9KK83_9BACI|nr:YvrJ family protein [Salipaludibacillus neizhouensis]RKL68205.1 hypothetical protein CR203_06880 [Salipaludibacillus neizhouensis]